MTSSRLITSSKASAPDSSVLSMITLSGGRVVLIGPDSDGQLAELGQFAAGKREVEGFEQLFEAGLSSNHNMQDQIVQEEFLHLLAIAIPFGQQLFEPARGEAGIA